MVWSSALLSILLFAGRSHLGFGALALLGVLGGLGFGIHSIPKHHSFKFFQILLRDIIIFVYLLNKNYRVIFPLTFIKQIMVFLKQHFDVFSYKRDLFNNCETYNS
jgi:hypothetical protein